MGTVASKITSLTIVYTTVYSDADQSKHQSPASLAFVWGIHLGPVNSPHKWPVTRKMFPLDDVVMQANVWWLRSFLWICPECEGTLPMMSQIGSLMLQDLCRHTARPQWVKTIFMCLFCLMSNSIFEKIRFVSHTWSCWWPDDIGSQFINSHVMDPVRPEYPGLINRAFTQ